MSYLLFLDESGHDHKQMPYEVRGGVALHASKLWRFVEEVRRLEMDCFGKPLAEFKAELKGCKLLNNKRLKFAAQGPALDPTTRRSACLRFLTKGLENGTPTREEITAYGQACVEFARGALNLLHHYQGKVFACAIPRGVKPPTDHQDPDYIRKDVVFLLERYFYHLEEMREHGLLIADAVEKAADTHFVRRLRNYFTMTKTGRYRTSWIVPSPLFVSSDMAYPVQIADLCIYIINRAYRLPHLGMDAPVDAGFPADFAQLIGALQFRGEGYRNGEVFRSYGVVYVPDPYHAR